MEEAALVKYLNCLHELLEQDQVGVLSINLQELTEVGIVTGALADSKLVQFAEEVFLLHEKDFLVLRLRVYENAFEHVLEHVFHDLS